MYVYGGRLLDKRGCGMGVTVFPTGGVYEGEFLNGELHGKGHLVYKVSLLNLWSVSCVY